MYNFIIMNINSNSRALVFDDTIINDSFTCLRALKELTGDIYIMMNSILQSNNEKIKKYILQHGIFGNNIITINKHEKIITIVNQQNIETLYKTLTDKYISVAVITSSLNIQLHSKINNMNCELYYVNINDLSNIIYEKEKNPIYNQFKSENNILQKYKGNHVWEYINTVPLYGISPINKNQEAYLNLLLDDSVSLVMCIGQAGTGKTFLACLAGIYGTYDLNKYNEIIISRSTVNIGENSIGFLPGSKEEKMEPWIQPIKDNLKTVMDKRKMTNSHVSQSSQNGFGNYVDVDILYSRQSKKQRKKNKGKMFKRRSFGSKTNNKIDEKIKIECISFFRGITLNNSYCIIDECQNLTHHEIKTIITRIGKKSKLIMIGDDSQSDLKTKSNGFTHSIYGMCDNKNVGIIKLNDTVRSDIAQLAVKNL